MIKLVSLALGALLLGSCAKDGRRPMAQDPLSSPQDQFSFLVTDPQRRDPIVPDEPRKWMVRLYLPTDASSSQERLGYADDAALIQAMKAEGYYDIAPTTLEAWLTRSAPDLPENVRSQPIPLITLSPGQGVAAFNYGYLASELVRRGFAVAIIDHPYVGISRLPDGRILNWKDDPLLQEEQSGWTDRFADWARDIPVTLNELSKHPQVHRLELTGVTAIGHSLGGAIALDACAIDDRISACADFEGAPFGTVTEQKGPSKPALFVLSRAARADRPTRTPDFCHPMFAFLAIGDASAWAVEVVGGSHMSFSDAPLVMPETLSRFGGTLMDAEQSMATYATLATAFASAYRPGGGGASAFQARLSNLSVAKAALTDQRGRKPCPPGAKAPGVKARHGEQ